MHTTMDILVLMEGCVLWEKNTNQPIFVGRGGGLPGARFDLKHCQRYRDWLFEVFF